MKPGLILLLLLLCVVSQSGASAQLNDDAASELLSAVEEARNRGNMGLADTLAHDLMSLAVQSNQASWQAKALYQQARNSMERNQYEQSHALLTQSIALFETTEDRKHLADAYRQLGLTYRYKVKYPLALEYIYSAMQIYQELGDKSAISAAYSNIGVVLEKMGQLEEAAQAHNQALTLHNELGDKEGIASALFNLGDIFREMGDLETSLSYFKDVLTMDLAQGDPKNIAYSYNKLGYVYNQLGKRELARANLSQALELFKSIEAPRDTDWALTNIAQLELDEGNAELAKQIIDGVIERANSNEYKSLLVDAYLVAVKTALELKQFENAITLIDKGVAQTIANGELNEQASLEALRVEALVANDKILDALNALKLQKALENSILNAQRNETIARVQAQADFMRQAQRIKLLENEQSLQQATIEQARLHLRFWIMAIVGLSVLTVLIYSRINQQSLNKKLSRQVQERTQELESKNLELTLAYERMEAISLTDNLTGINNRRFLEQVIENDLTQSVRKYNDWRKDHGEEPQKADIVFFLIDVDDFKKVNDQHGHVAGDAVLRELVERMSTIFRQSDYLVRWGGEEFVAVARFIDKASAAFLAQRIVEAVNSEPFSIDSNKQIPLTCSVGYSCFAGNESTNPQLWRTLLAVADACLYISKYSGKNGWLGIESVTSKLQESDNINSTTLQTLYKAKALHIHSSFPKDQLVWTQSTR